MSEEEKENSTTEVKGDKPVAETSGDKEGGDESKDTDSSEGDGKELTDFPSTSEGEEPMKARKRDKEKMERGRRKFERMRRSKEDPGSRRERARKGTRLRRRRSMSHIHISSSMMQSMRKKLEEPSSPVKKKGTSGLKPLKIKPVVKVRSSEGTHTLSSPVPDDDALSDSGSYFSRHDSEHTDGSEAEVGSTYLGIIRGGMEFEDYESHEERFCKVKSLFDIPEDFMTKTAFPRKYNFSTGGRIPLEILEEKEKVKKNIDGEIVGKKKGGKLNPFGKKGKAPLPDNLKKGAKPTSSEEDENKEKTETVNPENCLLGELVDMYGHDWEVVQRNYEVGGGRRELKRNFLKIFKKGSKRILVGADSLKSYNCNDIKTVPIEKRISNILMLNSSNRTIEREPPYTPNLDPIIEQRILLCCRQLYFSVGRFEPLFCKIALYNMRTRQKLTNDFHFHFNSKVMLGFVEDQDDELNSMLKYVSRSAKTVAQVAERDPDIVVVLIVSSIFGSDNRPYSQPKKYRNFEELLKRTNSVSYLSYFLQPIAFGYTRIYRRKIVRRDAAGTNTGIFSTLSSFQRRTKKKKKKEPKKRYATLTKDDIRSIMFMQGMTEEEIDEELKKSGGEKKKNDDDDDDGDSKKKKKKKKKLRKVKKKKKIDDSESEDSDDEENEGEGEDDSDSEKEEGDDAVKLSELSLSKKKSKGMSKSKSMVLPKPVARDNVTAVGGPGPGQPTSLSATLRPDMFGRELKDGMEEQLILKEGIIELSLYQIPLNEKNNSVMDLIRRKEKQSLRYDGKFYVEVSDASIYDYYGDDYFSKIEENPFKKIEQYCEWDQLMELHFNQCDNLYPVQPLVRFKNVLYLFPRNYQLSTSMIGGLVGTKKQNITLKFIYRTTDSIPEGFSIFRSPLKGKRCIFPKYWIPEAGKLEDNLRAKYFSEVIVIGDKKRLIDFFTDEIQMCLPKVVGEKDNILVTVYNVIQKKLDLKTRQQEDNILLNDYTGPVKKTIVGFSFFPVKKYLVNDLGIKDDVKNLELTVYKNILDGYLTREKELKKIGGRKINVGLRPVSSINPSQPLLNDFFKEMMILFQNVDVEHKLFVQRCIKLTETVIPNLGSVETDYMRPHTFTIIHIIFYTFGFLFEKRLQVIKKKGRGYGGAMTAIQNLTETLFRFLTGLFKTFPRLCYTYIHYAFQIPNTPKFFFKKKDKEEEETEGEDDDGKKKEEEKKPPKPFPQLPPGIKLPAGIKLPPGMNLPGGMSLGGGGMGMGGSIEESFTFVLCTTWITMLMGGSARFGMSKQRPRASRKKSTISQRFFGGSGGRLVESVDVLAIESAGFLFDLLSKVMMVEKEKVNDKVLNLLEKVLKMFVDRVFSGFTSFSNFQERLREEEEKTRSMSTDNLSNTLGSSPKGGFKGGPGDGQGDGQSGHGDLSSPCGSENGPLIITNSRQLNERLSYFLCEMFNHVSRINLLPLRVMHYYYCKVIEPLYEKKLQTAHVIYESDGTIQKGGQGDPKEEDGVLSGIGKTSNKLTILEKKLRDSGMANLKYQLSFLRIFIHHPCFLNFSHPLPYKHKLHCILDIFVNVVIYSIVNNRNLFPYDEIVAPYLDLFYDHLLELDMDPLKQTNEAKQVIAGCYFAFFEKLIEMNYLYVVTQLTTEEITDMMTTGSFSDNFRKRAKSILKQSGTQATGLFSNESEIIIILKHLKGYERIKLCCVFLFILENLKEDFFQRWLDEVASTQPSTVEHYIKFLLYMLVTFVSLERPRFIYFSQLVMKHFRKLVDNVLHRLLEDDDYKEVVSEILRFSFQLYESQHCPKDVLLYYIKNVTQFVVERLSPKLSLMSNDIDFQKSLYHMLRLCKYPLETNTCLLIRECLDLLLIHHRLELKTTMKKGMRRKKLFRDRNPHRYLRYKYEEEIEGKNMILNTDAIADYKEGSIKGCSLSKLVEYITLGHALPPATETPEQVILRDVSKEVFFITHKSFISTMDLLNCFFSLHDYIKKRTDPIPARKDEQIQKVINGLASWISDFFVTFDNDSLVFLILNFINRDSKKLDPKHQILLHKSLVGAFLKSFQLEQGRTLDQSSNDRNSPSSINREEQKLAKIFNKKSKIPNVYKKKGLETVRKEVIGYNTWKELSDFILTWNPMEIARQWCLIEFEIFERIRLIEFFKKQGERENIDSLTQRFNGVTNWVQTALVSDEDPKERLTIAKKFIVILQNLYQLQNLYGMNEIVSCFNLAVIERLFNPELVPKSWPKLTGKHWSVVQSCTDIMSHDKGYKMLRDELANKVIGIPFIGLYQTDLVKIEIGNVDFYSVEFKDPSVKGGPGKGGKTKGSPGKKGGLKKSEEEEGGKGGPVSPKGTTEGKDKDKGKTEVKLINLNKRLLIAKTLHPITKFQQMRYPFQKVSCLYEALKRIATRNDFLERKDIYALSLKYKKR